MANNLAGKMAGKMANNLAGKMAGKMCIFLGIPLAWQEVLCYNAKCWKARIA